MAPCVLIQVRARYRPAPPPPAMTMRSSEKAVLVTHPTTGGPLKRIRRLQTSGQGPPSVASLNILIHRPIGEASIDFEGNPPQPSPRCRGWRCRGYLPHYTSRKRTCSRSGWMTLYLQDWLVRPIDDLQKLSCHHGTSLRVFEVVGQQCAVELVPRFLAGREASMTKKSNSR